MDRTEPRVPSPGQTRKFGAAMAAVLWVIAVFEVWRGRTGPAPMILGVAGFASLVLFLLFPRFMRHVQRAFTRLALCIGRINTTLLLGIVFFGLITPVAALLRRFRTDPLRKTFDPGAGSYWLKKPAESLSRSRFDRMY
jgi:hypothetical protein